MKRTRTPRMLRLIALVLFAVSVSGLDTLETTAQIPGKFFGFGDYPGGTLHTVFEMQRGPLVPVRTYATDIELEGDQYHMTESIVGLLDLINIDTALGKRGAAAVAGGRYAYKQTPQIDLSPLGVLEEYGVVIEPNQTYYLPDGASLVTGDIELIAGIEAIKGTFTHPEYPTQRAVIGTPIDLAISALLQYPVYFRVELEGEPSMFVQLIEFSYLPQETQ